MIDKSMFCIVYYKDDYVPKERKGKNDALIPRTRKSGTRLALDYAIKKKRQIRIFPDIPKNESHQG